MMYVDVSFMEQDELSIFLIVRKHTEANLIAIVLLTIHYCN